MIRDLIVSIAEILFSMTGGEMLMNTLWFFPWILIWALLMSLPMFYVTRCKWTGRAPGWPALAFMIMFFPCLLMATGPGIVQAQMMQECETTAVPVSTDRVDQTISVQQCRYKSNYYGEFGPWQVLDNRPR